jgi:hypothetical protein
VLLPRVLVASTVATACLLTTTTSLGYREVMTPDGAGDVEHLAAADRGDWSKAVIDPDEKVGDIIRVRARYGSAHLRLKVDARDMSEQAASRTVLTARIETKSPRRDLTWQLTSLLEDGAITTTVVGTSRANQGQVCHGRGASIDGRRWQAWVGLRCLRHAPWIKVDVTYHRDAVNPDRSLGDAWRDRKDGPIVTSYCHDPVPPRRPSSHAALGC